MDVQEVRKFSLACHGDLPKRPQRLSDEDVMFIAQMVSDEMEELKRAKDLVEQADALVDAIYYMCDLAARKGINLNPLFDIVHEANMKKVVDGKVIRREDGKVLKPEGWKDPRIFLEKEMQRQVEKGAFLD